MATATSFYYSSFIGLYVQLSVLIMFPILSLVTHHFILQVVPEERQAYDQNEQNSRLPSPMRLAKLQTESTTHM